MVGSALFAVGAAPGIAGAASATVTNGLFFVGAWFFTAAGLMQLALSARGGLVFRAEWWAAAIQSIGTVLFNVSTSFALIAATASVEERLVWRPDAGGSVAFLVSAVCIFVAFAPGSRAWSPSDPGWWAAVINMLGCIAFGVSAVGGFIEPSGASFAPVLANGGTFLGALCFFVASLIALPQWAWNRAVASR